MAWFTVKVLVRSTSTLGLLLLLFRVVCGQRDALDRAVSHLPAVPKNRGHPGDNRPKTVLEAIYISFLLHADLFSHHACPLEILYLIVVVGETSSKDARLHQAGETPAPPLW